MGPDTFQPYNAPPKPSGGGLKAAFDNQRLSSMSHEDLSNIPSTSSIQTPEINRYSETEFYGSVNQSNDGYIGGYHSIHRLDNLNHQHGGNLQRAFEARIGGTGARTLGRPGNNDISLDKHANLIVSKMERDESLMEDSPSAEELRRTALRDMPQCLTVKRKVKVKLSKSVSKKSKKKTLSCYKMFKYRTSMAITKLKLDIRDLAYSFELWYSPLKKIEGNFGTGVASYFKLLRWLFLLNAIIAIIAFSFIVIPVLVSGEGTHQPANSTIIWDLFTGEGYLTNTVMYYGFYTFNSISTLGTLTYSITNAYFFSMAAIYFVSFFVLGVSAAKSYRRSFIETEGGLKNVFANKVFCGWDYNIATRNAAELKSKAIYHELKELINDVAWRYRKLTFYEKSITRIIQFFMNVIVLGIMLGTGYAIWLFLDAVPLERGTRIIVAPVFINLVMTVMPMLFSFMIKYEDYKNPKWALLVTLLRTFVLGGITVGVLCVFWLSNDKDRSECWETSLGQELYRMILFDFIISVIFAALFDCILYGIYRLTDTFNLEFDIAWNTMQIIYNQTLFWVGLVFVPLLPVVIVIKLFLIWYIRQFGVLCLCKPSSKTWRAAQTTTWFLVMTFLSFLLVGGFLGYVISYVPLSSSCGPFRNYVYFIDVITHGILNLKSNSTLWSILLYITKPGVIALIIIALGALVYILRAKANAQKDTVAQYREILKWSAKDKEFYYFLISKITDGEYLHKFNDKSINPELHPPNLKNPESGDIIRAASSSSFIYQPSSSISVIEPTTPSLSYDYVSSGTEYALKKHL